MSATPPLVANRYRLMRALGEGGMGRVWLAHDGALDRDVAVKEVVPPPGLTAAEQADMGQRTLREARATARLNHPNVVRVYDVVQTDKHPWIVMEYVQARSLQQVITDEGRLPPQRVAVIGLAVLGALAAAHRAGVLHRDVKPSNVLLTDDGRVVLTDFGLATLVDEANVTRPGLILGSPAYIAPERARDGRAGPEADMWSLGATLYAAVEGQSPYFRSTAFATLTALATEEPRRSERAGALRPLLEGLLRREPRRRIGVAEAERRLRYASGGLAARVRLVPTPHHAPDAAVPPDVVDGILALPGPTRPATPPLVVAEPDPTTAMAAPRRRLLTAGVTPWLRSFGRRPWLVAAVVAVLVLVGAVGAFAARDPGRAAVAPKPSGASTGAPVVPASAAATPAPSSAPSSPSVLPAGWYLYQDWTGFSVAAPTGWNISREGAILYFRDPNSYRVLGIDQTNQPHNDPAGDWVAQEQARVNRGDFPGYRRIRIESTSYFATCADWEFTYDGWSGRTHVINRGFVTSDRQAYGIWWSTAEYEWGDSLRYFQLVTSTFRPKP